MRIVRVMTDDGNDSGDTIPITVRVPRHLVAWLKERQAAHARDTLSGPGVVVNRLRNQRPSPARIPVMVRPEKL